MGADAALRRGVPDFWRIKSFVPHCFHGRDREGRVVTYSKPAAMDLPALLAHGLDLERCGARGAKGRVCACVCVRVRHVGM